MANDDDKVEDGDRRNFILNTATSVVAGAGIVTATVPFVSSMNPSADVLLEATSEASLKGIEIGELRTVAWQGKPVFILRRTDEQITKMQASDGGGKDPEADSDRVKNPEWFIAIGLCTHLGCVPNRNDNGWFCPCHGSVYDNSGRILHGPAPRNLDLLPYKFVEGDKLILGEDIT